MKYESGSKVDRENIDCVELWHITKEIVFLLQLKRLML